MAMATGMPLAMKMRKNILSMSVVRYCETQRSFMVDSGRSSTL